ncbi:MAG: hypothetical protein WCE54_13670 [Ignavibacteriaceae bacterium]
MWQGWIDLAVGIWLIVSGFITALRTPASMLVAGAVAIVFGFWGASRANSWQGTINGIIGIWLFLSAIWFSLIVPWNFFVFGVAIAILAIWNIAQNPEQTQTHMHAHAH